jgi:hypothetical protein
VRHQKRGRRVTSFLGLAIGLLALLPAAANAAGGANIASAPTVAYGQHTFGNTATGKWGCQPAEYWNLSMKAGDQVTVDWATTAREYAYKALIYPAGTTDFSINNVNALGYYEIGSNNHAEAVFSTGTSGSYPLIFVASGCGSEPHPGPYDFTATIQHGLTISLKSYAHIRTTTVIAATASTVDGVPVPDGLAFNLTASWPSQPSRESVTYTATSLGGAFAFPLALPETAKGKLATLIVSRPADAQYLAAESAKIEARVGRGAPPVVVTPCEVSRRHVHSLARQHRRLKRNAKLASGANRRRIQRRARRVGFKLRSARNHALAVCG